MPGTAKQVYLQACKKVANMYIAAKAALRQKQAAKAA